ncbi:MAG: hypothetical protein WBQ94_30305 [Terracidiphilus sp.]
MQQLRLGDMTAVVLFSPKNLWNWLYMLEAMAAARRFPESATLHKA